VTHTESRDRKFHTPLNNTYSRFATLGSTIVPSGSSTTKNICRIGPFADDFSLEHGDPLFNRSPYRRGYCGQQYYPVAGK